MIDWKRIAVIGVGLIGGSLAITIKKKWPDVSISGYDIDQAVLNKALTEGIIDEIASTPGEACRDADFIFLAAPVSVIPQLLEQIGGSIGPDAIVTDVGSTKSRIVAAADSSLPHGASFIGGHPMAGSEQEGLQAATGDLFADAVYVLTPTEKTSPVAFQKLHALLTGMGAKVMALTPEKHDQVVASVSHLPHVLAAALVNLVAEVDEGVENRLLFAAGGFRDMTRIAGGNPDLWVQICLDNQEAINRSIDRFSAVLQEFKRLIKEGDAGGLLTVLDQAKGEQTSLAVGRAPVVAARQFDLPVTDKPGTISRISLTLGQFGINIEDIQIVPLSDRAGIIKILVQDHPDLDRAVEQLKDHGFEVIERT